MPSSKPLSEALIVAVQAGLATGSLYLAVGSTLTVHAPSPSKSVANETAELERSIIDTHLAQTQADDKKKCEKSYAYCAR